MHRALEAVEYVICDAYKLKLRRKGLQNIQRGYQIKTASHII